MLINRAQISHYATWAALEVITASVFSVIGLLIIASVIGPNSFGISSIALGIMQAIIFIPDTLFGDAIVQRRRLTYHHLGSAFWTVVVLSLVLCTATAALAGVTARIFRQPELSPLLLSLSPIPICSGLVSIQSARLRRAMQFHVLAGYTAASRAIATFVGIGLALAGYGPWAPIAQFGLSIVVMGALLLPTTKWRLVQNFSMSHAREIGGFAIVRTVSHFVDTARGPLFLALLGYYLSPSTLGQVSLAFRLVDTFTKVVCTGIMRVLLPMYSRLQNRTVPMAQSLRQGSSLVAALAMPIFAAIALTGDDVIQLTASTAWQGMEGLIPWLCVAGFTLVAETPVDAAVLAIGRPALLSLAATLVLVQLMLAVLLSAPTTGLQAVVCWTLVLLSRLPIYALIVSYTLRLGILTQIRIFYPSVLTTSLVAATTIWMRWLVPPTNYSLLLTTLFEIAAGGCAYLLCVAVGLCRRQRRPEWG